MKIWIAIPFTIALATICLLVSQGINFNLTWFLVLGTSLWAAIDSAKLELRRYRSQLSGGPAVIFIGCAFLWLIVFPWYLALRHKIRNGTARLKEPLAAAAA